MPTETRWSGEVNRRALRILVGYNFPWALWTAWALALPLFGDRLWLRCPVVAVTRWCPGCGLTRSYGAWLYGEGFPNIWLALILAGFAINAVSSLLNIQGCRTNELSPKATSEPTTTKD